MKLLPLAFVLLVPLLAGCNGDDSKPIYDYQHSQQAKDLRKAQKKARDFNRSAQANQIARQQARKNEINRRQQEAINRFRP